MEFIHRFFELNHDVIYFAYGLVFFLLGATIALQSRNYSRLDLARSLNWLAAFGFAHGLYEWGDLFIPIQASYLSPETVELLYQLHLLLLAVSFTFLFEFGVALLKPLGRARWLHGIPGGALAAWIVVTYLPLPGLYPDSAMWRDAANALARYLIGFPGALVAAYGLRQHALQRIVPLNVPHIAKMLQYAGVALAFYAVFGGLIVPPIAFFPGNVVNVLNFELGVGVPPSVFRSLIGLGLVITTIRALEVFDVETARMIERMEQQQILAAERSRIARELHDGAIQKVYTAGLLMESARNLVGPESGQLALRLERAASVLNDAVGDLRRNLGDLHSTAVEEPFPMGLRKLVEDPRFQSLVDVSLDLELPASETLSPVRTDHVLAVVNEALSNVMRHSLAGRVKITTRCPDGRLNLTIEDDGVGIPREVEAGYGLRNMRDRARLLGGHVEVNVVNGKGTRVALDVPWKDER